MRKRDAIIGVSVSETKAETAIVIAIVTENSRNRRPMMPLIIRSGISTATSETEIEMMVKPISAEPLSAASKRLFPLFDVARDVLEHHDRVVDDEADGDGEGHQRQIVEAVAGDPHQRAGAQERQRHRNAGNDRRPEAAQENEDHHHDERDGEREGELDVVHGGADGRGAVGENADVNGRRDRSLQRRQRPLDRLDGGDDVRAGHLEHDEKDARLAVAPGRLRRVLRSRDRLADVAHAHRRPVAIGDDDVVPGLGLGQLVVVLDGEGLLRTDDRALGAVDRRDADLRAHVLELQPLLDELRRIDLDAYGGRLLAADAHERDARDLAEVLGEDVFGGVVDVDNRRDVRLNGQDEDGRVGRVDLAIGRRTRQILRQLSRRRR